MPDTFATTEPLMTKPTRIKGLNGETLEISAYARAVMLDVFEGPDQIDVHLSLTAARELVQDLSAAIMAAELLGTLEPRDVRAVPWITSRAGLVVERLRNTETETGT